MADQSKPLRPCAHNYHHDKFCQFHLFGFSLRARLLGTCPAPCHWPRHEPQYCSRVPFSSNWNRHIQLPNPKNHDTATTRRPASFRVVASPFRAFLPVRGVSLENMGPIPHPTPPYTEYPHCHTLSILMSSIWHPLVPRPFPFTAALFTRPKNLKRRDPGEDTRDDRSGSSSVPVFWVR